MNTCPVIDATVVHSTLARREPRGLCTGIRGVVGSRATLGRDIPRPLSRHCLTWEQRRSLLAMGLARPANRAELAALPKSWRHLYSFDA